MLEAKILIAGKVVRIDGNKIYIRRGETMDVYNSEFYRVVSE